MATPQFVTVAHELEPLAKGVWTHFNKEPGKLFVERQEHDYPETATMFRQVDRRQYFIICETKIKEERLDLWTSYGKACRRETHVVFCVSHNARTAAAMISLAKRIGAGICVLEKDGKLATVIPSRDLTFNVALPPLNRYKNKLRRKLEPIHRTFEDDWKRGFEDACKLIEAKARQWLVREAAGKAVALQVNGGKQKSITAKSIERQTLGQLAHTFCSKIKQTKLDNQLCSGLTMINPDRVDVTHSKLNAYKLKLLKQRVCGHMWTIGNLLSLLQ